MVEEIQSSQTKLKPTSRFKILEGDALMQLQFVKSESIDTVFTSPEPPYTYEQLLKLEQIMLQLPRVLKPTGGIWINLGDVHNADGVLTLIPERFVLDMVLTHGWQLRSSIIWNRSSRNWDYEDDRRFRRDHEYLYWFVKDVKQHYFDEYAAGNPTVMNIPIEEKEDGKFSSGFPQNLIWPTAINTTPSKGRILDPFCGTGTTGVVALESGMEFLGIEANPALIPKIIKRLNDVTL
jgi:DNA modification methylase